MPAVGDVYALTPSERLTVRSLTPDLLVVDAEWAPVEIRPIAHHHPVQDEHFEVHAGELTAEVDGERRVLRAGDTLDIPRGTAHKMWNSGDVAARATWEVRPAGQTAEMWAAMDAARRRPGATDKHGMLTPLAAAPILKTYRDAFRLALPAPVERVAITALAAAGRARGH